jgi:hypothetical protein
MGHWRRMSRLRRYEIRRSIEKRLLLLGSIANKFGQRIHGFCEAGGAKGIRAAGTVAEFSLWGAGPLREIPQPWS